MFLQFSTFLFAIQWLGAPWQLNLWKGLLTVIFFLGMIVLSCTPTLFREWGNLKKRMALWAIGEIIVTILAVVFPGIGTVINIVFQIIIAFLPLTFYKKFAVGIFLFLAWFAGLNFLLGLNILEDPRGVFSGDLYFSWTDWTILAVFSCALARSIYHSVKNYPTFVLYNGKEYDISYVLELAMLPSSTSLKKKMLNDIINLKIETKENVKQVQSELTENVKQRTLDVDKSGGDAEIQSLSENNLEDSLDAALNGAKKQVLEQIDSLDFSPQKMKGLLQTRAGNIIKQSLNKKYGGTIRLLMANTNAVNESLQYKEKKTLIPAAIISVVLIIVSAFIPPSWKTEAENALQTGFVALETGDIQTAQNIADSLYNDKKQLYNGDVFLLKGLLLRNNSLEEAIDFFERSGKWYDHHKSWISARNNGDAYYYLSQCYTELPEPNYNKAENAINKALKDEPLNNEYIQQKNLVDQKLAEASIARKAKTIGFFEGIWTKIKSLFGVKS